ncbi:MAG: periplasmic nitrate reductase, NapE protein [Reinekea sp.]|jgi:periplasmic nitrate reductase NapE
MTKQFVHKSTELKAFLFITVFLFPILSICVVGGYGFLIWMSQLLFNLNP